MLIVALFIVSFWSIVRTALPRPYAYDVEDCGILQVRGHGGFFTRTGARIAGTMLWGTGGAVVKLDN